MKQLTHMKRGTKVLFTLATFLMVFTVAGSSAFAADFKTAENVTITSGQTQNGDLYAAGQRVVVDGTINGDLFVAGATVEVTGTVTGGVFASGSIVRISGKVGRSVHAAGGTVEISGDVQRDVMVFGGTVDLFDASKVHGDLIAFGGESNLSGTVLGKSTLGGGTIRVSGTLTGDVSVRESGTLALEPTAVLSGNLNYQTDEKISDAESAQVQGTVSYQKPTTHMKTAATGTSAVVLRVLFGLGYRGYQFLALLLVAAVLLWLFPRKITEARALISKDTIGTMMLRGVVAMIVVPIVAILLLVTVVGIPLGLISLAFFGILWTLALLPTAWWVGNWALSRSTWKNKPFPTLLMGLALTELALAILTLIPVVGFVLTSLVGVWGFGVVLSAVFPTHLTPKAKQKTA